jgi:hypothetical protein
MSSTEDDDEEVLDEDNLVVVVDDIMSLEVYSVSLFVIYPRRNALKGMKNELPTGGNPTTKMYLSKKVARVCCPCCSGKSSVVIGWITDLKDPPGKRPKSSIGYGGRKGEVCFEVKSS